MKMVRPHLILIVYIICLSLGLSGCHKPVQIGGITVQPEALETNTSISDQINGSIEQRMYDYLPTGGKESSGYEGFQITEHQLAINDIMISYPIIEIPNSKALETEVNAIIYQELLLGMAESDFREYTGVFMIQNNYVITYADESFFSICLYSDVAQGMGKGVERWSGMNVSLKQGRLLTLDDLGVSVNSIISELSSEDIALTGSLASISTIDDLCEELIGGYATNDTRNFFVQEKKLGLIINNNAASRAENGVVEVLFE